MINNSPIGKRIYDTIVVGLGGAGSASLYQLSKTGRKVLGIDRFKSPHHNGSSHGDTRIIRQAYFEGEYYVPFVKRAYTLWDELEKETNTQLFMNTGCLNIGTKEDRLVERCKASSDRHNVSYKIMNSKELNENYPFFNTFEDKYSALLEKSGGLLYPEKCVDTFINQARKNKADVAFDTIVENIKYDKQDKLYTLQCGGETYTTKSVVLSCGSWIIEMLKSFNITFHFL